MTVEKTVSVTDKGFFPWVFRALFQWKGSLDRLPFLGAAACYLAVDLLYSLGLVLFFAHHVVPPPAGATVDGPYLQGLLSSGAIPFYAFLPIIGMRVLMQAKRLRSIGVTPWIAVLVNLAKELSPVGKAGTDIVGLFVVCYYALLLFVPQKDRAVPVAGGGRWPSGKDGKPRKLSGEELSDWKVIEPETKKTRQDAGSGGDANTECDQARPVKR